MKSIGEANMPPGRGPRRKTPTKTGQIRARGKLDVLLGRGKGCTCSQGNQRYLSLIEKHASDYVQAKTRREQNHVKMNIIREVQEYDGHFLQPVEGSNESQWEEASMETVLNKIAQSLRHHIRKGKVTPSASDTTDRAKHHSPNQQIVNFLPDLPTGTSSLTTTTVAAAAPMAMKPTDLWMQGFQLNQQQQPLVLPHRPLTQPGFHLDEWRELHLPTFVTTAQQQQQHFSLGVVGGEDSSGLLNNDLFRKMAYLGRMIQDDPSNSMEV